MMETFRPSKIVISQLLKQLWCSVYTINLLSYWSRRFFKPNIFAFDAQSVHLSSVMKRILDFLVYY